MSQNFDKTQFEKGFANIALVVVIVILVGVAGYFALVKKSPPLAQQTPTSTPTSASKSRIYENQYMKVTIPSDWKLTEATRTIQDQSYDKATGKTTLVGTPIVEKTGAVNITKGAYILYINTQAEQTSGIIGGRFNEISGGALSVDAVITDPSAGVECSSYQQTNFVTTGHSRVDLYVSAKDKQDYCNVPTNGKTVWFFSYIADETSGGRGYFNYYVKGEGPTSYVITMAYNSKDVNSFPVKGGTALNSVLNEMTTIVKSLEIKQK